MPALTWDSGIKWDSTQSGVVWDGQAPTNNTHKMAEQDLAQVRADDAWITQLETLLDAVIAHLATKAVNLTTEQRKKAPGIGPENASMATGTCVRLRRPERPQPWWKPTGWGWTSKRSRSACPCWS